MHQHLGLAGLVVLAIAACGPAIQSKQTPSSDPPSASEPSASALTPEAEILHTAAVYEAFEAEASALALARGQRQGVRDFATSVAQGHDAARQGIAAAAQAGHLAAPDAILDEDRQAYLGMLSNAPSAQFDTTYTAQQTLVHMAAIGAFDHFLANNSESPLRPWAETNLARLRERLDAVRAMPQ